MDIIVVGLVSIHSSSNNMCLAWDKTHFNLIKLLYHGDRAKSVLFPIRVIDRVNIIFPSIVNYSITIACSLVLLQGFVDNGNKVIFLYELLLDLILFFCGSVLKLLSFISIRFNIKFPYFLEAHLLCTIGIILRSIYEFIVVIELHSSQSYC